MPPRVLDDRPFATDKGYVEKPRPPIGAFARQVRDRLIDETLHASYRMTPDNDGVVFESLRDYLDAARRLGALTGLAQIVFQGDEEKVTCTFANPRSKETIRLEVRLGNARVLLRSGLLVKQSDGTFRASRPLDDRTIASAIEGLRND